MHTCKASSLDLFTDSLRLMGDATLCGVMEFDKELPAKSVQAAAQACLMAHPILCSRLVRKNGPAYWEILDNVQMPKPEVIMCGEYYHHLVQQAVSADSPPLFSVKILRRPSGDVLVVNLAHAAADGFGLSVLMNALLEEYKNPGKILPEIGGIPQRDTLWTAEMCRAISEQEGAFGALAGESPEMKIIDPMWPDPFGTSDQPFDYHRIIISPDELSALKSGAKKSGASINDAILSAYFMTMSTLTGHYGPIDIFYPVNLRQYLSDDSRVMSNQSANVSITLERRAQDTIKEILLQVSQKTAKIKRNKTAVTEQAAMDSACDQEGLHIQKMVEEMANLQEKGFADIFISNPGALTLADTPGLCDAYICYPGSFLPTTSFIASTFLGHMTVTIGFQKSKKAQAKTWEALMLFKKHLLSISDLSANP